MNTKLLGGIVIAFAVIFFGGNLVARSGLISKACDCSKYQDLVIDVSNAVYVRREFRNQLKELRKMDELKAHDEFEKFVAQLNSKVKAPKCYTGPSSVEFIAWGNRHPVYSLSRFTDQQLCEPSETTKTQLQAAKAGSCCDADAAATEAHEKFHQEKCLGMGYKNYREMGSADRAAEEAEAYTRQISTACATLKTMSCPNAADLSRDLATYCR